MLNVNGKTAFVTGAATGIGAEIISKYADAGMNVVINYLLDNDLEKAEKIKTESEAKGVKALVIQGNVTKHEDVIKMFETIKENFETIDVVVNNAGITRDMLVLRMKPEDFDAVIDVNLKGAFLVAKEAAKVMLKQRFGNIINMSSIVGVIGNPGQANYCASKAGLIGMTKSLAKELASRNIRVNAIAPGFIVSDMTDKLTEQQKSAITQHIPLQKLGTPEDIANMALFLASDLSSYVTGQVMQVDGGMG
jgi:3-oxoacyl-(acyl-carrier-protein) reductase